MRLRDRGGLWSKVVRGEPFDSNGGGVGVENVRGEPLGLVCVRS